MLKENRYVSDMEFASAYVRTQVKTTKKGPKLIKDHLISKKIKKDYVEQAMKEYTFEMQVKKAISLTEKMVQKEKTISSLQLKQKIQHSLMTKGFGSDAITIALEEVTYTNGEDQEYEAMVKQAEKALTRYNKFDDYTKQQKLKQFLARKGFSFELINKYVDEQL
ncbi:RecX family transcriptional regulator [Bacillus carboniphilus]